LFSVAVARGDLTVFHGHLRQCQQGSAPVTTELTLAVCDRNPVPVQLRSIPIRDPVRHDTMYRTTITDISARVRAEETLRQAHSELEDRVRERTAELAGVVVELRREITERQRAEAILRLQDLIVKNMAEGVCLIRARDSVIIYANPTFEKLFGYDLGELNGKHVSVLNHGLHDKDPNQVAREITDELIAHDIATYEVQNVRKDGTPFWCRAHTSTFEHPEHGTIWVAVHEDITERKRGEEALRQLSVRLLQTQDEERRRIARELHDSTGQKLAALAMNLSLLGKSAETLDARARKARTESLERLDRSSRDIRTLSYLLHPPLLDERGLAAAVRWFTDGFTQRSGLDVKLEVPADLQRLPEEIEIALFRIVQEGLTNTHRHSGSSTATIRLMADQNHVQLEMRDAGKGLPKPQSDGYVAPLGVGITGMRERVKQLGGQMKMESGSRGTIVSVTLPLTRPAS
jgi:PAS domain S-box-containing protein